jgi:hypothetical protein
MSSVRGLGVKLTIAAGLLLAAGRPVADLRRLIGHHLLRHRRRHRPARSWAGLVIPAATGSVMGAVPGEHTVVAAGTNGTLLQTAGALGVAVIGSLMSTS